MKDQLKNIGMRIKESRRAMNIKQKDLAEKSNLSRSYLSDIERGRYIPSLKTLIAISSVINIDLNFLNDVSKIQE